MVDISDYRRYTILSSIGTALIPIVFFYTLEVKGLEQHEKINNMWAILLGYKADFASSRIF